MLGKRRRVALVALATTLGCYGGKSADGDAGADGADGGTVSDSGVDSSDGGSDDDGGTPPPAECDGEVLDPGPNLIRRLTVTEYGNTVEAVLGVDIRPEAVDTLPAELRADGFTNGASGLIVSLAHVEGYDSLAEVAVSRIADLPGFVAQYTSCQNFEDTCQREFVENFGRIAFRRPLEDDEVTTIASVFAIANEEGQTFDVGAGLVIEAMLQSPPFLYRQEDETTGEFSRELGGYEMASRLSYLLWSGPPDLALLDAAEADALQTDEQVIAEVDRMLADPRATQASLGFVYDWLHLARLDIVTRDPERFPDWGPDVGAAMQQETLEFFSSVAWDQDRALLDLFNAQETWLTPELAAYYGIESEGDGLVQYDVTDMPERGGLFTQGALLTIGGDDASMVARGLFMFEHIVCLHPQSPPEGVDTTPPPIEPGRSQRFYSEERLANPSCAGCHTQFEPLAFGLERFLADGNYAEQDSFGNELREDGEVILPSESGPQPYSSAGELMEILAQSADVQQCLGVKGTQFAIGRPLLDTDDCSLEKVQTTFDESGGTWRDLMVAIALSPGFRSIRVEEG